MVISNIYIEMDPDLSKGNTARFVTIIIVDVGLARTYTLIECEPRHAKHFNTSRV